MTNTGKILNRVQDDKNKRLVSIIIVSWNGLHWLMKSLPSLEKITYKKIEIILVDNSSKDGTIEWVKKHYPSIKIISINSNLGFAEANNRGFESSKGEYVLFLNNDVEVTPEFVTELINVVRSDSTIAGAQSKILLLDDKNRYDSIGAFLTPTGFLYHYCFMNKEHKKYDKQIDLFTPKGACMLFKRSALQNILIHQKLFDPDAFAYFEETDMAHRIWLSGKRIVYAPSSVIYHKMGGTSTTMNNAFIQYHSFKNRIASYIKNLSLQKLISILLLHFFMIQLYAFVGFIKGKFEVSFAIERSIWWNISNIHETFKKRKEIQQHIRKVSDDAFWKNIFRIPPVSYYKSQMLAIPYEDVTENLNP